MRLDKFISEGGSLTLTEIGNRFNLLARPAKDILDSLYPNVSSNKLSGNQDGFPRYTTTTKKKL
jgi:hypothetical protein